MDPQSLQMMEISTCLSPSVHRLITAHTYSEAREELVLDKDGLLDLSYICSQLPAPAEAEGFCGNPNEYFCDSVKSLAPMFHSVEDYMEQKGEAELTSCLEHLLSWTGQQKVLLDLWRTMCDGEEIADMLVLLVTTAIMERALGDVYLTKGPPPCPSMLKDLLLTRELSEILGKNIIQVLRILIGPPISLNLRNVAWHGFPSPGEIPRRCIWFIILLVPSIGKVLLDAGIQTVTNREPVHLPSMKRVSDVHLIGRGNESWVLHMEKSDLVSWSGKPFWETVVQHYNNGRYPLCAALLLFYMEQGLRRVFATVNNSHHRVLTAESTTLFTTFDEILGPFLPDGTNNMIQNVLGTSVMEILLDLLMYQDGPRLRDRLSHGELDWMGGGVQGEIIHSLMVVTIHLSAMFSKTQNSDQNEELKKIGMNISNYKVQFHRITLIQNMVQLNADAAHDVDSVIVVLPDLSQRDFQFPYPLAEAHLRIETNVEKLIVLIGQNWSGFSLDRELGDSMTYRGCAQCRMTFQTVLSHKTPTLYREAKQQTGIGGSGAVDREAELLTVLQHTVTECSTILSHINTCAMSRQAQLEKKELRSRQRENFKKFLNSFPSFVVAANVCGILVVWQLYYMDAHDYHEETFLKSRIKVWKAVLQFCENLRTFSHPEKNKWLEGLELIAKFTKALPTDFENKLAFKRNNKYLSSVVI